MNPENSEQTGKVRQKGTPEVMEKLLRYRNDSKKLRTAMEARWARNIKLTKGIPLQDLNEYSNVRRRKKIFFRKIWATCWRLLASLYQAFLQDPSKVKYSGRPGKDSSRAKVLQRLVDYRVDFMTRRRSLFIKHMWAMKDIVEEGYTVGKLAWRYQEDEDGNILFDEPHYTVYPLEQSYLDWAGLFKEEMRYVQLDSYMTREQLDEHGYDNLDQILSCNPSPSELRAIRYFNSQDPLRDTIKEPMPDTTYPKPGSVPSDVITETVSTWYRVTECFWKHKNKIYFGVINPESKQWLKKPDLSPYGDIYPIVTGSCLLEQHKTVGEGFPESMEGPQESLNMTINQRKDSVALELAPPVVVDRYANVDMQALLNRKVGSPVLADSTDAVKLQAVASTTQNAYIEAAADQSMMDEISGVNPTKRGETDVEKTGVAQINLSEGSAKTDLYVAIVAETYFKEFYYLLGHLVQKFETDEELFKMANNQLREEGEIDPKAPNLFDIEFDMEVRIDVGVGVVGRSAKVQEGMMVMDRAVAANNSMALMAKSGLVPPTGVRLFDITKLAEDIFADIGKTDIDDYFVMAMPMPQAAPPGGKGPGDATQGQPGTPQPNASAGPSEAELADMAQALAGGAPQQ